MVFTPHVCLNFLFAAFDETELFTVSSYSGGYEVHVDGELPTPICNPLSCQANSVFCTTDALHVTIR